MIKYKNNYDETLDIRGWLLILDGNISHSSITNDRV